MLWVVLLLIASLAAQCFAQEVPANQPAAVPELASANLGSSTVASVTAPQAQSLAAMAAVPASAVSSSAQLAADPPLIEAAAIQPLQPMLVRNAESSKSPVVKLPRTWWLLTAAQHGAATFDAWSTRKSLTSGNGYERNPLMKPFADSSAVYPVIQVLPLGLDYLSRRMVRSHHPVLRKTWWLPQTLATAGFVWSGLRNLRVAAGK
jgi:hypothetical protein